MTSITAGSKIIAPNETPHPARVDFEIAEQLVGSVLPQDAQWLASQLPGLSFDGEILSLNPVCSTDGPAVLDQIAELFRNAGRLGKWRNEKLRVTTPDGSIVGLVERAAARALGIKTFAVHLMVYGAQPGTVWMQQRAFDKANDPGMWDTAVGGLVSGTESFLLSLHRESQEEAGLDVVALEKMGAVLKRGQSITVRRNLPEGFMHEDLIIYDIQLPPGICLENQDGEVAQFQCWSIATLVNAINKRQLTLEAILMCQESLERNAIKAPLLR